MTQRPKPPIVSPFDEPDDESLLTPAPSPPPPAWDPQQHPMSATILTYQPGQRLQMSQGGGFGGASLLLLAALLLGWLAGVLFHQLAFWVITSTSVAGLYVLIRWKAGDYHSLYFDFDFRENQLQIQAPDDAFVYDLGDVTGVSVAIEEQETWWSSTLAGSWRRYSYKSFNAQVMLQGLLEGSDLVIAETGFQQRDKELVLLDAHCLAHSLATTLDVSYIPASTTEPTDAAAQVS